MFAGFVIPAESAEDGDGVGEREVAVTFVPSLEELSAFGVDVTCG